jgi:hypothetical protein
MNAPVLDEGAQQGAFLSARAAADRGAYLRWFKAEGIDKNDLAAVAAADTRWRSLSLLRVPGLLALSQSALGAARGRRANGGDRFPASLWLGGARDTDDGRDFLGTAGDFVKLLHHRATVIAPKGKGWVIEPTTNPSGRRTNDATVAMHALFLDCDGTGEWIKLLTALDGYGFVYVAYQSGGWSSSVPKWRVVLPLHAPFSTTTDVGIRQWKGIYNHARIVFGAVGDLLSVGFDPATETPCCPWFLTEKRAPDDSERQIIARLEGYTLDLAALALALPEISDEEPEYETQSSAEKLTLSEERQVEIIDALAAVTNHVPIGRRDLYLALPGVLLDRGVPPDDVFAIIEGVSASYPRHHAEKHADNLHNARTTITRWEAGTHYTRIGVLNTVAPDVAAVLDRVLPNLATKGIADNVAAQLAQPATTAPALSPENEQIAQQALAIVHRMPKLSNFGRAASKLAGTLKQSKRDEMRLSGLLIECFIKGASLPSLEAMSVDEMVQRAMTALGRGLPLTTTWPEALDFAGRSLLATDFTQSTERVAAAERAFYEGRGKRGRLNHKKQEKVKTEDAEREQFFSAFAKAKGR